jgi:hypothetical protein
MPEHKNAVVAAAQDTYREMMKKQVAPGLRALGFKGSGQNYELPSDDWWAMLGFQKSAYSDSSDVRFTINLLVVSRVVWESERATRLTLPARPTATTGWGNFIWRKRIGLLIPPRNDLWWKVTARMNTDTVAAAVLCAVEDHALPAMREQMRDSRT